MSDPSLDLFSDEWASARRACDATGGVFVAADAAPQRPRATAASERRSEKFLRERLEAWWANGAEMSMAPRKADWVANEGARIAGSAAAARRVWSRVTSGDERFAKLRPGGRRPRLES